MEDVILKDCPYELVTLELSESIEFDNWTLPRFLRMKGESLGNAFVTNNNSDLVFDDPLYVKAIIQKKGEESSVPPWKQYLKETSSSPKKRVQKDQTAMSKLQRIKRSKQSPTPKPSTPDPSSKRLFLNDSLISLSCF